MEVSFQDAGDVGQIGTALGKKFEPVLVCSRFPSMLSRHFCNPADNYPPRDLEPLEMYSSAQSMEKDSLQGFIRSARLDGTAVQFPKTWSDQQKNKRIGFCWFM